MARKSPADATLIVGCGYIGQRVAERLLAENGDTHVYTLTRSRQKASQLARQGFLPLLADWTDRRTLASLPRCQRVLVAVGYDPQSGIARDIAQVGGFSNLLDVLPEDTDLCYLSTTGVYHQSGGSWVDENSPARPLAAGGQSHLRAESLLHRRRPRARWAILRLAGIYGPGRIPRVQDVISGRPLNGPNDGYLNLIHREDAVAAILSAWQVPERPSRLYVVSDDQPVIRRAFYEQISRLTDAPPPTFSATGNPTLSARSGGNKRIWNRKVRRDLLPQLQYPSYIQGLTDLLR